MNTMRPLYRLAAIFFSFGLHGAIVISGFLLAGAGALPEEKIYRVSLAEFVSAAPAAAPLVAPAEEPAAPPAELVVQSTPEPKPEPVPVVVPPKPTPRLKPQPEKPHPKPAAKPQQSAPAPANSTPQQASASQGTGTGGRAPYQIGGMSAYSEDTVDQRPSISRRVSPEYPDSARRRNIQGEVVIRLVVDTSGMPQQCAIHSSNPEDIFDNAALTAARKTRFIPGKVRGQPVNTVVLLPYKFALR